MKNFYSGNDQKLLKQIAEINQIKQGKSGLSDHQVVIEYILEKLKRDDFHLQPGPSSGAIKTLVCRTCGSDQFMVGQGAYFTAIKCVRCGYEAGIHEG